MTTRFDIWEYREDWSRSLAGSLTLHCVVITALAGYAWWNNRRQPTFGEANAQGGGTVGVNVVNTIPIPQRQGRENRVAEDTDNEAPRKVSKDNRPKPVEDEGIALDKVKRKVNKKNTEQAVMRRYLPEEDLRDRLQTTTGRAATTPMFSVPNAGNLGTGANDPFGDRFGWYAKLLRDAIARKWRTDDVPANIRTLPAAIVTFTIQRDGKVGDVRIVQASGNYALDNSARRAVLEAAPFQPLPPQFERNSATVELLFELKR
jgi:protein TonB